MSRPNVVMLDPKGSLPASSVLRRVAIEPADPLDEARYEGGRLTSLDTIASALAGLHGGNLGQYIDLANEAMAMDPHLASVAVRRFGTIAAAEWELVPAVGPDVDKERAKDEAEEATAFLEELPGDEQGGPGGIEQLILDLAWALYHGRAALELVWSDSGEGELASIEWIPTRRIGLDRRRMPYVDPRTTDSPMSGWWRPSTREAVPLADPKMWGKFIYAAARQFGEQAEREGLAYRSIYWAAFKRFGMRERIILAETYAKPYKILGVQEGASVDEATLRKVQDEVEAAGSSLTTVRLPRGMTLGIEWPQEVGGILRANTETVNEEISKLYLGQTMTTADGSSRSQAEVHERQQNLLHFLDAAWAQRVLTAQLLRPRAMMRGGEEGLRHCPRFKLKLGAEPDRLAEAQVLEKAVGLGMQVSAIEAHERLGFRMPADGEEILGAPAMAAPPGEDGQPPPGAPGAPPDGAVPPPADGPPTGGGDQGPTEPQKPATGAPDGEKPPPKKAAKLEAGEAAYAEVLRLYREDQDRDDHGRFAPEGAGAEGGASPAPSGGRPPRVRSNVDAAVRVAREARDRGERSVSRAALVKALGREPTGREWAAFRNEAKARLGLEVVEETAMEQKAKATEAMPPGHSARGAAEPVAERDLKPSNPEEVPFERGGPGDPNANWPPPPDPNFKPFQPSWTGPIGSGPLPTGPTKDELVRSYQAETKKIEERTAAKAERVDPSLYHVVRPHPGAPLRPELSSEGRLRAWRVGAQVGEGEASALVEAWKRMEPSRGDVVVVSEKHGTTWTAPVAVGTPEAVASLVERGMFERVTADDLQGVRVTKAGVDAINAGLSEEERLLERIKRASPEELAEQFKARKARLAEAAKAAKAERAAAKEKAAADATKGNSETAAERFRAWGESHHKTAEERADRLRERADKAAAEAASRFGTAEEIGKRFEFGQPILVGHHSEKRARRDRERIDTNFRKGFAAADEAKELRRRADAAESSRAVSSDDPDALPKLRARLEELEAAHEKIKARPHERYEVTNSGANIRRVKQRIEELGKLQATPTRSVTHGPVTVEENGNRTQLVFPGKPSEDVRRELKHAGFRWSPREGVWQRQRSSGAWYEAERIAKAFAEKEPKA